MVKNLINNFWNGNLTLWKSYWLVGELINALIIVLIFNLEITVFKNKIIASTLPFLSFEKFNLTSKLLICSWTFFITVGIWRAAEKYKGNFIWIAATLVFLSYRVFALRLIFIN